MDVKLKRDRVARRLQLQAILFSPYPPDADGLAGQAKSKISRRALFRLFLFCAATALFARTHAIWSAYPFGLALICASNRFVPLGALALCLGAASVGIGAPIYISVYALAIFLRIFFSYPRSARRFLPDSAGLFREVPQLRISAVIVSSFAIAVYELLAGGLKPASLLYGGSMIALSVFFCALFIPFFESELDPIASLVSKEDDRLEFNSKKSTVAPIWVELSLVSVLFVSVLSLGGIEYFGISADLLFSAAASLVIARRFGPLRGCAAGLITSLGVGLDLIGYTPAFALLGLVSGFTRRGGVWLSAVSGTITALLLAVYSEGAGGVIELLPELTLAMAVALPIMKLSAVHGDGERAPDEKKTHKKKSLVDTDRRIERLGETFSSLSDVFYNLSDTMKKPELSGGARVSGAVWEKYCSRCPRAESCAADTGESLRGCAERLASGLLYREREGGAFAELLPSDCPSLREIVNEAETALASCLENRRRAKSSEIFAFEYDGVAKLLAEAAERDRVENREDVKLGIRLRDALRAHGIVTGDVAVYGQRRRFITAGGIHWEGRGSSADELRSAFEEICGCRLSNPAWEIDGEYITLELSSVRKLSASLTCLSRGREERDGDLICSFENREDYFYALLSDGMGSGEDAAFASGICGVFLEKMLTAGNTKASALRLLNNLMRNKGSEASATIDLFELDLLTARACFIKSGAAPSYVRRGENLFRIRSKTVPIGILRALDAEQTAFDVCEGDLVIMLSDGILQTPEEAPWLVELLSGELPSNPEELAQRILDEASAQNGTIDDMTVGIVQISAYQAEEERILSPSPQARAG